MDNKNKGGLGRGMRAFTVGSTIAIQFAASVLIGLYGGRFLDGRFGTEPWLMVVGLLLGLVAGSMSVHKMVSKYFD